VTYLFTGEASLSRKQGGHQSPSTHDTPVLRRGGYTPLPPIRSMDDWIHILHTHSQENFSEIASQYDDDSCLPCMNVSGVALLHPSLIHHYTYGGWQGTLKVQECLDGPFKLLHLDPSISLIQPLEADQFLVLGEASSWWTRAWHFPEEDSAR